MGCAPAYLALAVEAIAEAGAADGLDPELLAAAGGRDARPGRRSCCGCGTPADLRGAVASPGGSTEAGLEALDRDGAGRRSRPRSQASLARMRGQ